MSSTAFDYSRPYRAISSEQFVPQIDLVEGESEDSVGAAEVVAENASIVIDDEAKDRATSAAEANPSLALVLTPSAAPPAESEDKLAALIDNLAGQDSAANQYLADDLFIKASDASLQGNVVLAAKLFRYLVRLRPQDLELQRKLAMELVRSGEVGEALQIVEALHQKAPFADESITLALAGLYTVQQQPAQAMQIYQQALVHFPQSENVCAMAIEAAEQNKDLKQADAIAAAGFKRMPVALFAYYRGRLALAQEKLAVAKKFMRQALKLDPQYRPAALVLGLLAEQEGDFKTAKKVYQDFLQRNESDLVIIDRLLQIYFNEQDFSAALAYAERLANLDASDLNLKLKLGILYLNAHRLADARGIFQEILAAMPDADKAWYYLGATEILVPDQAAAFQAWEHISEDSSLFAQARLHQAQLLWATAKKDPSAENEQAFMAFLDRYQTSPKLEADLLLIRAAYLQEQGERAAAIALLRKLGQEKKLDSDGQYYFMAILQEDGQKSEAMQVAEQLIKDHPDHAHALNFLGYALLEDPTKLAQAKVYIDKAAQLAPDDYHIRDSVAWYYYQVGDYAQAAREIKTALKDAPEDPSLNQHAGLIALSLKRPQEACQYLQQAWKFAPEDLRSEIAGQAESCPNFDFSNAAAPENPVPEVENQTADVAPSPSLSSPLPSANAPEGKPEAVGHAALEEGPSPSAAAPHKSEEPKALTPLINPLGEGADDPILLDPQDN